LDQAIAYHVQRDPVARSERDHAHARGDDAVVRDLRSEQRYVAVGRADAAVVDDAAGGSDIAPDVASGVEILLLHAQRGGHEAADVDARARREVNASRAAQEHLAICGEAPVELDGAGDAVQRNAARGLRDEDGSVGAGVETGPVAAGARRNLVYRKP